MLFDWFNASKSKEFGITLANFYAEREQKTESGNNGKKEFERRQKELLLKMKQLTDLWPSIFKRVFHVLWP